MEFQQQFADFQAWAFDLSAWPQRVIWASLAVVAGYLAGHVVAIAVKFIWRRVMGLTQRRTSDEQESTDSVIIELLASVIRGMGLLAGVAAAAWVFGFPIETLQTWAIRAVLALAILVAVWFVGAWLGSRVRKFGDRVGGRTGAGQGSRTLFAFLSSLVRFGALAVGLIAALQQFGFPIASLVAVVGAAGLAIALALQDTLKAVAAGVVIAVFRPYRLGDVVRIADEDGTVSDITPFTTVLTTIDNREVVITNDKAWGDVIVNSSARHLRRVDLLFSIDYEDNIDHAIAVIRRVLEADPRVRKDPDVWVKVVELNSSSVDLRGRAWCAADDWWDLRCDTLRAVKLAFDAEGITIPYPHQTQVTKERPGDVRERPEPPADGKPPPPRGREPTD